MNTTQARTISIEKVLYNLGLKPTKNTASESWFLSPFRIEKTASFKINNNLNKWFDFGEQKGGNTIDFVIEKFGFSISEALEYLKQFDDFSFHKQNHQIQDIKVDYIEKVIPLQHLALTQYLRSRGITKFQNIKVLKEVHYQIKDKKYFAIGFQNKSDGFEIRSKYSKICLGKKDVSIIESGKDKLRIFEGFFDYLAFVQLQEILQQKESDYLILNSVGLLQKNFSILEKYTQIETYLDNDEAGDKYTEIIKDQFKQAIDKRELYSENKDLNEYLMQKPLQAKNG